MNDPTNRKPIITRLDDLVKQSAPGTVLHVTVDVVDGRPIITQHMVDATPEDITALSYLVAVLSIRRSTTIRAHDTASLAQFGLECDDDTLLNALLRAVDLIARAIRRDIEAQTHQSMQSDEFIRLREQVGLMISLHGVSVRLDHIQRAYLTTNTETHYSTVALRKDVDNA